MSCHLLLQLKLRRLGTTLSSGGRWKALRRCPDMSLILRDGIVVSALSSHPPPLGRVFDNDYAADMRIGSAFTTRPSRLRDKSGTRRNADRIYSAHFRRSKSSRRSRSKKQISFQTPRRMTHIKLAQDGILESGYAERSPLHGALAKCIDNLSEFINLACALFLFINSDGCSNRLTRGLAAATQFALCAHPTRRLRRGRISVAP